MARKVIFATCAALLAVTPLWAATRGVVAELFTASWCGYCPYADDALGTLATEKGIDNFVPIAWHSSSSDPFYTTEAAARLSYYGVTGYPTCVFDGEYRVVGGSTSTYNNYLSYYDSRRTSPSPLTIEFLSNSYDGTKASVSVEVKLEEAVAEGHVIHVAIWEDDVTSGRLYNYVERVGASYEPLTATNANDEQIIKREFVLDAGWNKANLGVTVFVQNLVSKAVLQGRATKLSEGVAVVPTSLGKVKTLFR
jgi:thiol-disulfide isomerase/thioredoxin